MHTHTQHPKTDIIRTPKFSNGIWIFHSSIYSLICGLGPKPFDFSFENEMQTLNTERVTESNKKIE